MKRRESLLKTFYKAFYESVEFKKLFFIFVSMMILLSGIIVAGSYAIFKKSLIDTHIAYTQSNVQQIIENVKSNSYDVKNLAAQIYFDKDVESVIRNVDVGNSELQAMFSRLKYYKDLNHYIKSIYIYNERKDLFYTSTSLYPYKSNSFNLDPNILPLFDTRPRENVSLNVRNLEETGTVYTYIVYPYNNSLDAVVINLYQNYFEENRNSENRLLVLDQSGMVFFSPSKPIGTNVMEEAFVGKVFASQQESGNFVISGTYGKELITYSKYEEYIFIHSANYEAIVRKTKEALKVVLFCLSVAFAVLIFIFFSGGKLFYTRFTTLFKQVLELEEQKSKFDTKKSSDQIKELLMDGNTMSEREFQTCINNILFKIDISKAYTAVLFKVNQYQCFLNKNSNATRKAYLYGIENMLVELCRPQYDCEIHNLNNDELIMLVNINEKGVPSQEMVQEMIQVVSEKLRISLSAFIGTSQDSIRTIAFLYAELCELSERRFFCPPQCVLVLDSDMRFHNEKTAVEADWEKTLTDRLLELDVEGASESLREEILENRQMHIQKTRLALTQVVMFIRQFINKMEGNFIKFNSGETIRMLEQIEGAETLDEAMQIFSKAFHEIVEALRKSREKKHDQFAQKVIEMIHQRFQEPAFCQEEIADTLGISIKYANQLFRAQMLTTISAYLFDFRIEKARLFIRTTDDKIKDIAVMVGYADGSHFIANFKKKYGVTPAEYRKNIREDFR